MAGISNFQSATYEMGAGYPNTSVLSSSEILIKRGVWLYFWLIIFEGALRKWVLPGLSEPLLIIRDPLAIWLIYKCFMNNIWSPNNYVVGMLGITILSLAVTLILGHGNIFVALYGFRIMAIHFPLIFIIGRVFNKDDVIKLGLIILWITIGMTILVGIQFYSPQSAWVNLGVGGDSQGSGFSGAGGFYRVPGTFSFTNGLSLFYGIAAAFIFYFWASRDVVKVNNLLLIIASFALLAAIPLSISRGVLFEIILSALFLFAIVGKDPRTIKSIILVGITGVFLFFVLGNFSFFQTATASFSERLTNAGSVEGGLEGTLMDRFFGGLYSSITDSNSSFIGLGLGMGTNAGAKLMMGNREFLIAEGEWARLIGEMGFILGMIAIIIRGSLVFQLITRSWKAIKLDNKLPWMLMSFGTVNILQAQWAQPTALGFSALIGGLVIASFNES
ncbi:hypothetical protein C8P64_1332 [Christiangramia gaetbulicola]|uniref:O-antigen ligase-like membrane protein n=1 Tax=Christiangramia gaetbulicola TaxID=703340 RepID=A0A2T6ANG2_9FLAO|nr:hypothetical protein [Christiangramia gaetbulicola]PTX45337.1 hypothetical protein C8P64_1332 [Christiangramia gaetbulicola]